MKQIQFYKYAVLALIILNLVLIGFLLFRRPGQPHIAPHGRAHDHLALEKRKKFLNRMGRMLDLDEQQRPHFVKLARGHRKQMMALDSQYRRRLMDCFQEVSTADTISKEVVDEILQLERQKIEVTYQHFQKVKSILREDQQENFGRFTKKILGSVLGSKLSRKTRRKKRE